MSTFTIKCSDLLKSLLLGTAKRCKYSWLNYPGDATHCHRLYAGLVYISHSKPESYVTYSHYVHSIGSWRFPGSGSYYGYPSTNTTDACYNFESLINQAKLVKRVLKSSIGLFLWTFCYWSQSLTKLAQRKNRLI